MKQNFLRLRYLKLTYIVAIILYLHLYVETECGYNYADMSSAGETIVNLFFIYFFTKIKNFVKNTYVLYIVMSTLSLFIVYNINILYLRFFEAGLNFIIYIVILIYLNLYCIFYFYKITYNKPMK